MKKLTITAIVVLAAALSSMAQNKVERRVALRCAGRSCSQQGVDKLAEAARGVTEGSRAALGQIRSLTVAGDGTMTCIQRSGLACSMDQARMLSEIAAAVNMKVTVTEQQ